MGTFSSWARTVGGILEYIGVEKFQGNRAELRSRNSEEAAEWEMFLRMWYGICGDGWQHAKDIVRKMTGSTTNNPTGTGMTITTAHTSFSESLPSVLKKQFADKPNSFHVVLGIQLGKHVQTVFGMDKYRVERDEDKQKSGWVWRVTCGSPDDSPNRSEDQTTRKLYN